MHVNDLYIVSSQTHPGTKQQKTLNKSNLQIFGGGHDYLSQTRDPQRDVSTSVAGKVKRVERHLCRGLSDGLRRDWPDGLSRRG